MIRGNLQRLSKNGLFRDILAAVVIFLATSIYFNPLLTQIDTKVVDNYDGVFIGWVMSSVSEKVVTGGEDFWDANIYHPNSNTLAYSGLFLSDSILSLPIYLIFNDPIVQVNTALVVSQMLTMLMVFFLLHELTNDRWMSLALSLVYGFSGMRLNFITHLQVMSVWWLSLSWLALVKLSLKPEKSWVVVWWMAFLTQSVNSFLPGVFIVFSGLLFVGVSSKLRDNLRVLSKWVVGMGIGVGLVLLAVVKPYWEVSKEFGYTRPINDAMHFAMNLDDLGKYFWSPALYLVILISLIIIIKKKLWRSKWVVVFGLISLLGLTMALGPVLKWSGASIKIPFHIPLPYSVFYYLVPGFKGFRTPIRWMVLFGMSGVMLSGLGLKDLSKRFKLIISGLLLAIAIMSLPTLPTYAVPSKADYPREYSWLKNQPDGVMIELPMNSWGAGEASRQEVIRMLYARQHKKVLINGYSGFTPPPWEELVREMKRDFPSAEVITRLERINVDYIMVHMDEYPEDKAEMFAAELEKLETEKLITIKASIGNTIIYGLDN